MLVESILMPKSRDYKTRVVKKKVVTGTGKKKSVTYVDETVPPSRTVLMNIS